MPSDKTLRGYIHTRSPGIDENILFENAKRYDDYKQLRILEGKQVPLGEGILIFDEVKVRLTCYCIQQIEHNIMQVQSRIIWNSSNSTIVGYAMSPNDFSALHDVYEGLGVNDVCQRTNYAVQFLWRDLSSSFDAIGPYFTCPSTMEARFLHSMVVQSMLAFSKFGFSTKAILCDGASSNLAFFKCLCGYQRNDSDIDPWFVSPFNNKKVYLIVCPSHQVLLVNIIYSQLH